VTPASSLTAHSLEVSNTRPYLYKELLLDNTNTLDLANIKECEINYYKQMHNLSE